jgi:hypothetical protein
LPSSPAFVSKKNARFGASSNSLTNNVENEVDPSYAVSKAIEKQPETPKPTPAKPLSVTSQNKLNVLSNNSNLTRMKLKASGNTSTLLATPQTIKPLELPFSPELSQVLFSPNKANQKKMTRTEASLLDINIAVNRDETIQAADTKYTTEMVLATEGPTSQKSNSFLGDDSENKLGMREIIEQLGTSLMRAGGIVGSNALDTAKNALGKQTNDFLPLYSKKDMETILLQKNNLLNELSNAYLLLGKTEEKYKSIEDQLLKHEELHSLYIHLQSRFELLQVESNNSNLKLLKNEADYQICLSEKTEYEQNLFALQETFESMENSVKEKDLLIKSLQDKNANLELQMQDEKFHFENMETNLNSKVCLEQQQLRTEFMDAFEKAEEKIQHLEKANSEQLQQLQLVELENNRLKEHNHQLIEEKKSMLLTHMTEINSLEDQLKEFLSQKDLLQTKFTSLEAEKEAALANYEELKHNHQRLMDEIKEKEPAIQKLRDEYSLEKETFLTEKFESDIKLKENSIYLHDFKQQILILQDKIHFLELNNQLHEKTLAEVNQDNSKKDLFTQKSLLKCSFSNKLLKTQLGDLKTSFQHEKCLMVDFMKETIETITQKYENLYKEKSSKLFSEQNHSINERDQEIIILEYKLKELENASFDVNQSFESRLIEKENAIHELKSTLTRVQQELQCTLTLQSELQTILNCEKVDRENLVTENALLKTAMDDMKKEIFIENAKVIQQLNQENNLLNEAVQTKNQEISSLIQLLTNSKDICKKENAEKLQLKKFLEEASAKLQEKLQKEGTSNENLKLLLQQLQEKEEIILQQENAQKELIGSIQFISKCKNEIERELETLRNDYTEWKLMSERTTESVKADIEKTIWKNQQDNEVISPFLSLHKTHFFSIIRSYCNLSEERNKVFCNPSPLSSPRCLNSTKIILFRFSH